MKHKGHEYEVHFCDPSQDWGDAKGLFGIKSAAGDTGKYYPTYKEAQHAAKSKIDEIVADVPQGLEQWVEAIENCMVWTGYEDCHIDKDMALDVLKKAKIHFSENERDIT